MWRGMCPDKTLAGRRNTVRAYVLATIGCARVHIGVGSLMLMHYIRARLALSNYEVTPWTDTSTTAVCGVSAVLSKALCISIRAKAS